jgi:hypothetical protein
MYDVENIKLLIIKKFQIIYTNFDVHDLQYEEDNIKV